MGSWLFSSNPCNCSSCELGTHPGAHRLVYVRRPSELNAVRNALKTAATHSTRETTHSPNCRSRPFFSRVQYFQVRLVSNFPFDKGLRLRLSGRDPGSPLEACVCARSARLPIFPGETAWGAS